MITPSETTHLQQLLEQDLVWVTRARWVRWLRYGKAEDTTPISHMLHDDRIAARAWLRQQRHALHETIHGDRRAPDEWVAELPLYRALATS